MKNSLIKINYKLIYGKLKENFKFENFSSRLLNDFIGLHKPFARMAFYLPILTKAGLSVKLQTTSLSVLVVQRIEHQPSKLVI